MARNYEVKLSSFGSKVGTWARNQPTNIQNCTIAQLFACLQVFNGLIYLDATLGIQIPGTFYVEFLLDSTQFILSGGNPEDGTYSINNLPAGFTPLSCFFQADLFATVSTTGTLSSATGGSATFVNPNGTKILTYSPVPSAVELASDLVRVTFDGGNPSSPSQQTRNWTGPINFPAVSGTYALVASSYTITPNSGIHAGDPVTITGPNMDKITDVILKSVDGNNVPHKVTIPSQDFITQTPLAIVIRFPQIGPGPTVYVTVKPPTTPPVPAGIVTIIFADASGMYVLTPGKNADTIYDRTTPGATKDVNIPDPFIKTGFIP